MAAHWRNVAKCPTGQIKTFGELGPKYTVGRLLHQLENGDGMVVIVRVETGEEVEYRLRRIQSDPEAHCYPDRGRIMHERG